MLSIREMFITFTIGKKIKKYMVAVEGVEPSATGYEPVMLPLHQTALW